MSNKNQMSINFQQQFIINVNFLNLKLFKMKNYLQNCKNAI